MGDPLSDWRDTLQDLGLAGLVPPRPAGGAQAAAGASPEAPRPALRPEPLPGRPAPARSEARPAPPPAPEPRPAAPPALGLPEPSPGDPRAFPPRELWTQAPDLDRLEAAIHDCQACPLGRHRTRFVFGEGDPGARLMFVGEGPGRDEDLQGRPFVGRAGELLDRMIGALGLSRREVYIANVVKCRPPDNRTPTPPEAQTCLGYLRRQIELVRPAVLVALGATPLRELCGEKTGITRLRGQWHQLDMLGGIPVMPTFHPAYVLRQYTPEVRGQVWQDLQAALVRAYGEEEAARRMARKGRG